MGKRYKTPEYKRYEKEVGYQLPAGKMPPAPYKFTYEFGVSSSLADVDNPVKPLTDILQAKYQFNDKLINEMHITKVQVPKGHEYFKVTIESVPTCSISYEH